MPTPILGNPDAEFQDGHHLPDHEIRTIIDGYLETITLPDVHDTPFLFAPVGLIGAGKTTLTTRIAKEFSLVYLRTDGIRKILQKYGYNFRRTAEIAYILAKELLSQGYGVAFDADTARDNVREALEDLAAQANVHIFFVHINTPEDVILKRLHPDNEAREYRGPETIALYHQRKPLHEDLKHDFLCIYDGAGEIRQAQNAVIQKIKAALKTAE